VKFFDLNLGDPGLRAELDQAYGRVMDSGWMILGPELAAFEAEFAAACGAAHCVGVGNGLDALTLTLRAAGVEAGAEVIVPAHTFAATWMAVEALGAVPVPVEVDPLTYTIDAAACAAAVTAKTAAIVPVSLYGHPVDLEPLMALAERHGLFVLEDAAQSHGAASNGLRTGSVAHATAFSFYPTKNLGAYGDGGMLTTNDPDLAERLAALRVHGSKHKYYHDFVGVNSRLDALQAAVLRVKFRHLDRWTRIRQENAALYRKRLADLGVPVTPPVPALYQTRHVYNQFSILCPRRDQLQVYLKENGVGSEVYYPLPLHLQRCFADLGYKVNDFPVSERLAKESLALPIHSELSAGDIERVCEVLKGFYA
jgi:dTDP-4-amino-4,6-dideoxygalactose transaminase